MAIADQGFEVNGSIAVWKLLKETIAVEQSATKGCVPWN